MLRWIIFLTWKLIISYVLVVLHRSSFQQCNGILMQNEQTKLSRSLSGKFHQISIWIFVCLKTIDFSIKINSFVKIEWDRVNRPFNRLTFKLCFLSSLHFQEEMKWNSWANQMLCKFNDFAWAVTTRRLVTDERYSQFNTFVLVTANRLDFDGILCKILQIFESNPHESSVADVWWSSK